LLANGWCIESGGVCCFTQVAAWLIGVVVLKRRWLRWWSLLSIAGVKQLLRGLANSRFSTLYNIIRRCGSVRREWMPQVLNTLAQKCLRSRPEGVVLNHVTLDLPPSLWKAPMKLLFSFSFLPFFHFIYLHSSSREQTSKRLVYLSTQQYSRGMIRYHLAERTTGRSCTTPKPHPLRARVCHPLLDRWAFHHFIRCPRSPGTE